MGKTKNRMKNTMSMLEYCKLLLSKLSFDRELLRKEYQKGLKYLSPEDQAELRRWVRLKAEGID